MLIRPRRQDASLFSSQQVAPGPEMTAGVGRDAGAQEGGMMRRTPGIGGGAGAVVEVIEGHSSQAKASGGGGCGSLAAGAAGAWRESIVCTRCGRAALHLGWPLAMWQAEVLGIRTTEPSGRTMRSDLAVAGGRAGRGRLTQHGPSDADDRTNAASLVVAWAASSSESSSEPLDL